MKNPGKNQKSIQFDENRLVLRQKRAVKLNTTGADFLARHIADEFSHRLFATNRQFDQAGDFFSFSNQMSSALEQLDNVKSVVRYELPEIARLLNSSGRIAVRPLSASQKKQNAGSSEVSDFWPKGLDLAVSIMGLHSCNDISEAMFNLFRCLKSDGLMLISLPVIGTLNELRDCLTRAELELSGGAAIRVDSFIDIQQAGSLLQSAGFRLPVVDREEIVVRYDDIYALIGDLRAMGMTSALKLGKYHQPHRKLFARANELYQRHYADDDGRIRASFNYVNLTAWTPHENQQKPLKPGSAETSLAKYLKNN